jgi:hypothetical protein
MRIQSLYFWLLLLAGAALPAGAQSPGKPAPYADAQEDHAAGIATGAPLMLRPAEAPTRPSNAPNAAGAIPMLTYAPLPPRRGDKLGDVPAPETDDPTDAAEVSPPEQPAEPQPAAPSFFDAFRRLTTLEAPPPPPETVTPEELEEEEAKTPEPTLIEKQTDNVNITCLDPGLMRIIHETGKHFGGLPVITSGQRERGRKGSYHRQCKAADFFIPDVPRAALAKYLRTLPEAGGVGTYCHTKSVHLDIGEPRNWSQCGFRFRFAQR